MVVRKEVEGYDAFCNLIGDLEAQDKRVYVYFSGSKGADGKSWCPDCVKGMFAVCATCRTCLVHTILIYRHPQICTTVVFPSEVAKHQIFVTILVLFPFQLKGT